MERLACAVNCSVETAQRFTLDPARSAGSTPTAGTSDRHPGVCNGSETVAGSGAGPRGSALIALHLLAREIPDGGRCNVETDTQACRDGERITAGAGGGVDVPHQLRPLPAHGRCVRHHQDQGCDEARQWRRKPHDSRQSEADGKCGSTDARRGAPHSPSNGFLARTVPYIRPSLKSSESSSARP